MDPRSRTPVVLAAALLLGLLAVAGPGQEEPAPAEETPPEETAPPAVETLALRVERLERLVLGARAGEGGVSRPLEVPGADPTASRLVELERRLQRLELGASTPAGSLGQVESRLRQVEARLSRVESDLRTLRR